jgi:hypothetical protein
MMELMRRLISSWRHDIGESQAQSGPRVEYTEHFSPLVNMILPMGGTDSLPRLFEFWNDLWLKGGGKLRR